MHTCQLVISVEFTGEWHRHSMLYLSNSIPPIGWIMLTYRSTNKKLLEFKYHFPVPLQTYMHSHLKFSSIFIANTYNVENVMHSRRKKWTKIFICKSSTMPFQWSFNNAHIFAHNNIHAKADSSFIINQK